MDEHLTIGAMCAAYGVTARTLRFYEQKALIQPLREGPRRLYDRRARARLQLILRGKRFGFSLEDIRQTLDLYDRDGSDAAQRQRIYELALERLAGMKDQRDELDQAIADLEAELAEARAMGLVPRQAA